MKRKLITTSIFISIFLCLSFFFAGAPNNAEKIAPVSEAHLKYLRDVQRGIQWHIADDGH